MSKAKKQKGKQAKIETDQQVPGDAVKEAKPEAEEVEASAVLLGTEEIELDQIELRRNVRRDEGPAEDLADSFRKEGGETSGQLQAIGVELQARAEQPYRLIYGHQRLRAAQLEDWTRIRATIWDLQGRDPVFRQLAENTKRSQLGPIEEAEAYRYMNQELGLSHRQIAKEVGSSRSQVSKRIMLLDGLADPVLILVATEQLSPSVAEILCQVDDDDEQEQIARSAVRNGLTVRRVEKQVKLVKQYEVTLKTIESPQPTSLIIPEPVPLERFQAREDLTETEVLRLAVYALLRNGNDTEVLDYLEDHWVSWEQLWSYVRTMSITEAKATLEYLCRRYVEAPHRFHSLDNELKISLGPADAASADPAKHRREILEPLSLPVSLEDEK